MTQEKYIKEFKKFTTQEQQQFMMALMPDSCQTLMGDPSQMKNMMLGCSQMTGSSFMQMNRGMPSFRKGSKI